jgi:hypothetical protein
MIKRYLSHTSNLSMLKSKELPIRVKLLVNYLGFGLLESSSEEEKVKSQLKFLKNNLDSRALEDIR